jgi:2-dehydro-3-deoxyphosphogluconate aldolase/(4S)-4-hydroxy-2-oxoglutarate aldolase
MSHFLNSVKFVIGIDLRRKSSMKAIDVGYLVSFKTKVWSSKTKYSQFFCFWRPYQYVRNHVRIWIKEMSNLKKIQTTKFMYDIGALAIVRTETFERATEIAEGCIAGGIPVMEMSFTLNNAGEIIQQLKKKYGGSLCVGAGTVLDSETARYAVMKGADFIISPNFNLGVAQICNRYQIPYAPGCTSITEAVEALSAGAAFIKAFPISDFYGSQLIKVFKTPIPDMPILASGGITLDNLEQWMEKGTDICGFGSLLTKGTSKEIEYNAKRISEIIKEYR